MTVRLFYILCYLLGAAPLVKATVGDPSTISDITYLKDSNAVYYQLFTAENNEIWEYRFKTHQSQRISVSYENPADTSFLESLNTNLPLADLSQVEIHASFDFLGSKQLENKTTIQPIGSDGIDPLFDWKASFNVQKTHAFTAHFSSCLIRNKGFGYRMYYVAEKSTAILIYFSSNMCFEYGYITEQIEFIPNIKIKSEQLHLKADAGFSMRIMADTTRFDTYNELPLQPVIDYLVKQGESAEKEDNLKKALNIYSVEITDCNGCDLSIIRYKLIKTMLSLEYHESAKIILQGLINQKGYTTLYQNLASDKETKTWLDKLEFSPLNGSDSSK